MSVFFYVIFNVHIPFYLFTCTVFILEHRRAKSEKEFLYSSPIYNTAVDTSNSQCEKIFKKYNVIMKYGIASMHKFGIKVKEKKLTEA